MNEYENRYAGKGIDPRSLQGASRDEERRRRRSESGANLAQMLGNVAPLAGGALGAAAGGLIGGLTTGGAMALPGAAIGSSIGSALGGVGKVAGDTAAAEGMRPFDEAEREREAKRQAAFALMSALR